MNVCFLEKLIFSSRSAVGRQPSVTCPLNGGGWLRVFFAEVGVMLNCWAWTGDYCHNPFLNHYLFVQFSGVLRPLEAFKVKGFYFEHWTFGFKLSNVAEHAPSAARLSVAMIPKNIGQNERSSHTF